MWRDKIVGLGAVFSLALLSAGHGFAAETAYQTTGDCDGFPRIAVTTAPGLCVGLVANHLGFARGVAVIGDDIYVADMGGWRTGHGRILQLGHNSKDRPRVVLDRLDEPNALVAMPNGLLLVGMLGRVFTIDPRAAQPRDTVRNWVTGLPTEGLHPLPALALTKDGMLFINVGSATDHCETESGTPPNPTAPCPETIATPARATLIRIAAADVPVDARHVTPYARGLRNSLALALLPDGQLYAAANARDNITAADPKLADASEPHDTLVEVQAGADYGWPYCFDGRRPSPEYPSFDCGTKAEPTRLLPAHAAPLGMIFYRGNALPNLAGHLIIAYHGYRATGHRIVSLALDAKGAPVGDPVEIVSGWNAAKTIRPQGAPVALAEMADGSVLITEDHNGTLLRLTRLTP